MHNNNPHKEAVSQNLSRLGQQFFKFIEFDEGEELVREIHKHRFGLFLIEISGFLISVLLTTIIMFSAFMMDRWGLVTDPNTVRTLEPILIIIGLTVGLLGLGVTFIAAWLFRNNVIFITSEKIAQVLYNSLFNKKISQLSIGDVQDVTVTQNGIFPHLFGYGTMVIETAGEQQNYTFTYVPDPYGCSQAIVGTHEENLRKYGN